MLRLNNNNFDIIYITDTTLKKEFTINLIKQWNLKKSCSVLRLIYLDKKKESFFCPNTKTVKTETNKDILNDYVIKYDIDTYPSIIVLKNGKLIENISCSYNNILEILEYYF